MSLDSIHSLDSHGTGNNGCTPLDRERADTDECLRKEREKTTEEVAKTREAVEEEADSETASERSRADEALDLQRRRADEQLQRARDSVRDQSPPAEQAAADRAIARERDQTDVARLEERAETDSKRTKERSDLSSAVDDLLGREREQTDAKLGDERDETDCLVATHKKEIEGRKRSEEELARQHRRKDELLSVVTHDLRSPLTAILMNAAMISKHAPHDAVGEKMRGWANVTLRTGQRMERLVSDLMDGAAIESGALSIKSERTAASTIVREATEASLALAEAEGIRLRHEIADCGITVLCDPHRVAQVFANLLDNAIKHTPDGGSITVKCAPEGRAMARFSVGDSGPGIAANDLAQVFDRGWQAVTGEGGGLGLGLYIARGIVLAQNGAMGVESRPGSGATFWFTLPVA